MVPSILVVTPQYPEPGSVSVGGLYTHAYELVEGLKQQGCHPTVLTARLEGPSRVEGAVHRVQPSPRILQMPLGQDGNPTPEQLTLYNEELVAYVSELAARTGLRPDIIHCHDFWMVPCALELRRHFKARLVISVHMLNTPLRQWWGAKASPLIAQVERRFCHEADALIAVSASMKQVLHESLGVPEEKISVVHNGFDTRPFQQPLNPEQERALREQLDLVGARVVVFAGRLTLQKGLVPLLASAARVVAEHREVVYALAGTARERQEILEECQQILDGVDRVFAESPEVKARTRFLGNLGREQLAGLYRIAELAVVPSIYEPFGYAAVEPMAAGVPVVATAAGGLSEIIQEGESGLLVPVHQDAPGPRKVDIEALAQAQLQVLGDSALARRLGAGGQRRVQALFTQESMARQTLLVYQRMADARTLP